MMGRAMPDLLQDIRAALSALPQLAWWQLGPAFTAMALAVGACGPTGLDAAVNAFAATAMPMAVSVAWSAPAVLGGLVAPALLPLVASLYRPFRALAPALWLGFGLSLALVSALKAVVGRLHPEAPYPVDLAERAMSFTLFSGEIVEGWPSGHAATNGAVGLIIAMKAQSGLARATATGWTLWVWLAVVFGINGQVHWLSDMLAGAILAFAVARMATRTPP